jgi:hypothetical protein
VRRQSRKLLLKVAEASGCRPLCVCCLYVTLLFLTRFLCIFVAAGSSTLESNTSKHEEASLLPQILPIFEARPCKGGSGKNSEKFVNTSNKNCSDCSLLAEDPRRAVFLKNLERQMISFMIFSRQGDLVALRT